MARPHAVLVPYPGAGHINPALQLAKLLHHHGVYVTFVSTEFNHERVLAAEGAAALHCRDGFRFEAIPDGLDPSDCDAQDYELRLFLATRRRWPVLLRELIARLGATAGVPPVTCVVPTKLMSFVLDVAAELGIPSLMQWGGSACSLMAQMRLRELIRRGYLPLKHESCLTNGYLDTIIDWIPGMSPIRLGDISSFLRTTDPNDYYLKFSEIEANHCTKAGGLILNTFDHLESDVLDALKDEYPRIYTIGPLPSMLSQYRQVSAHVCQYRQDSTGLSLWEQDAHCTEWLDKQQPSSVVYVSFGSLAVVTSPQLAEFAWGLAASGYPFLWVIRPNLAPSGLDALPPAFVDATKPKSYLTTWCAQEQVLGHPSVGIFLTHNGWNSTCESICCGVPMICWPGFADQYTNCKYVCEEWGIGLRMDEEVRREQVSRHVKEVMEGSKGREMRRNAAKWRRLAEEATHPSGSSYENLHKMVHELSSS